MSYTALYRKFRPTEFEDVKGQEHIITTLQNQIKANRIGHAYLFCGTRGTGKTTVAKIFAKAVNCENPKDGSPCGQCAMCKSIAAGTSMNVIEIDAASNNGVDNIRQISEEVAYRPTEGRYKVYIIDEVHMLSIGAFNALLKTLEEPPSYVIFILATTEFHKIPATILSRCQKYNFRHISADTIEERLQELMDAEGVQVEKKALAYVAKMGDGSMRDALSLLDQCIAFHIGESLTYENVLDVLGAEGPPLLREHRLYQADFLLRFYGCRADELLSEAHPNFNQLMDPKCDWAVHHLELFPVEVNKADYYTLLRVPGIGTKSARRIIAARKHAKLGFDDIKKMGVVLKRALYFLTCQGKMMYQTRMEEEYITRHLIYNEKPAQLLLEQGREQEFEQLRLSFE